MINKRFDSLIKQCEKGKEKLTRGQITVLRAYVESNRKGYDELVLAEICWQNDLDDIMEILKFSGIGKFYIADSSTSLMKTMYTFVRKGFTVTGTQAFITGNSIVEALEISVN